MKKTRNFWIPLLCAFCMILGMWMGYQMGKKAQDTTHEPLYMEQIKTK